MSPTTPADAPPRELTQAEHHAVTVVVIATAALALLGFVNSFAAVNEAVAPYFGALAWTVPLGVDLGILVFGLLDIVMTRLGLRRPWLRLVTWGLSGATVYLNVAALDALLGKVAHGVLPGLWIAAVEVATHAARHHAGLVAGTSIERVRPSRWLLAPWSSLRLWRHMVLWEVRSYADGLARERARALALAELRDSYGLLAWRWKAPRRRRVLFRLGELTPGTAEDRSRDTNGPDTRTGGRAVGGTTGTSGRTGRRTGTRTAARPDVEALMPLGWRIAAHLEAAGQPLNRTTLLAALRENGQPAGNARVGALLARLRTEAPAEPAASVTEQR
jgi:hypothetical protein